MVNLDEREFKVVDEALKWICEDDPYIPGSFALQLVTAGDDNVTHSVRLLPGREVLYQSVETVFPGPPRWLSETDIQPRYHIPKDVIDSLEGVEFCKACKLSQHTQHTRIWHLERLVTYTARQTKPGNKPNSENVENQAVLMLIKSDFGAKTGCYSSNLNVWKLSNSSNTRPTSQI